MLCVMGDITETIGVTRAIVWKWIKDGELKATRIGRRWVIDSDDLMEMYKNRIKDPVEKMGYEVIIRKKNEESK